MGAGKATVQLRGRPLISYPLAALTGALGAAAVVAKGDSELPPLPGVEVWTEPDHPRHPLTGIVHALRVAAGRAVVVCAVDLPVVGPGVIRSLALAGCGAGSAAVVSGDGRLQPTLGCYGPAALGALSAALERRDQALTDVVRGLRPKLVEVTDPEELVNVNTADDLARASAILGRRRLSQPNVKS